MRSIFLNIGFFVVSNEMKYFLLLTHVTFIVKNAYCAVYIQVKTSISGVINLLIACVTCIQNKSESESITTVNVTDLVFVIDTRTTKLSGTNTSVLACLFACPSVCVCAQNGCIVVLLVLAQIFCTLALTESTCISSLSDI